SERAGQRRHLSSDRRCHRSVRSFRRHSAAAGRNRPFTRSRMMGSPAVLTKQSGTAPAPVSGAASASLHTTDSRAAVLGTYRPAAPLFTRAHGCQLFDGAGNAWLDFASGIGVNALGYDDAGIAGAL